jgi:hypothetical protein
MNDTPELNPRERERAAPGMRDLLRDAAWLAAGGGHAGARVQEGMRALRRTPDYWRVLAGVLAGGVVTVVVEGG